MMIAEGLVAGMYDAHNAGRIDVGPGGEIAAGRRL
jgi:hypothetical protein